MTGCPCFTEIFGSFLSGRTVMLIIMLDVLSMLQLLIEVQNSEVYKKDNNNKTGIAEFAAIQDQHLARQTPPSKCLFET